MSCLKAGVVALAAAATLAAAIAVPTAHASQLIGRNATAVHITVNEKQALVTFRSGGAMHHVLAWGAVNARSPQSNAPQVKFQINYTGKGFTGGSCKPYTGPTLAWVVAACDGPDGSFWTAQAFPQPLPDLGFTPWLASQRATWLEISHWTGPVPQLTVGQDWVYGGKNREIYGQLKYLGVPVYGLHTTRYGVPTGGYGTLIYLDVLDAPAYGPGWHRENSFVPHKSSGGFCYGFYTFDPTKGGYKHPPGQTGMRGPGVGTMYRLTAHGPGAAPDVEWTGPALGPYDKTNPQDPAIEAAALNQIKSWGDTSCTAGHSDF
ncbi:MAG TPA: hypothetical protein VFA30_10850 [Gaiellaceae bacterium]|nr:hypothetical protein [Gaiellaceae bacterium]